jgi:rubrerythrin
MASYRTVVALALAAGVSASAPARAGGHEAHGAAAPATAGTAPLAPKVLAGVHEALADERRTEDVYRAVLAHHVDRRPFSNAARAEARHAEFLEGLLTTRGLAVPERPKAEDVAVPSTIQEACAAAVAGEKDNVAIYDRLLASGPLPEDVRRVFEHNRWASQERHLRAFERCAGTATSTATASGRCSARGCARAGLGQAWAGGQGRGPGRGAGARGGGPGRGCGRGHGCDCRAGSGPGGAAAKPAGAGA